MKLFVAISLGVMVGGGCADQPAEVEVDIVARHGHDDHGHGHGHGHGHHGHCQDEPDPIDTLADAAERAHRLVGTAVDFGPLTGEPQYLALLEDEFDYITPGNETKWGSLQPVDPQHWSFAQADTLIDGADDAHQDVKGHTLVWHNQLPPFVNDSLTPQQLERYLERHIDKVVSRYHRDIRAWDVVNEAVADDGTMRDTVFLRKLGPGYIANAFRDAHRADRDAKLYYNDYNIDVINAKSNTVYALVQSLLAAHVPIDGVGFQMHLEAQNAPSTEAMVANLKRFADLGLSVNVSELDVRVARLPGDMPTKLAVQKQVYHRVVAACMQVPRCVSVTTWGFTDRHSWIDSTFGPDDPLEYDDFYQRKPAYYAIVDGFLEVPPDPDGTAPNLVPNSTFEAGTDGWVAWGGTLEATQRHAHTGARSARVTDRTATFQGPVHDVRAVVRPGRGYDVSAWARVSVASDTVTLTAKTRCQNGTDLFTTLDTDVGTNTGWVELTGALAVPTCVLDELAIYVEGPAPGVTLYADDLAVRPQPGEPEPNLIANPGFESGTTGWFGFGGPTLTATAAQAHTGAQSVLVSNRTASFQGPGYSLLGVAPPGSYSATGWVRLDNLAAAQIRMTLKTRCGTTDAFAFIGAANATNTSWAQITGTFSVPSCALTDLVVYFEGPAAGVSFFVDDVAVRPLPAQNIIANPGFEIATSGWFSFGGATLTATTAQAHSGASSGLVTNRTGTFQGPGQNLLAATSANKRYAVIAWGRVGGVASSPLFITQKTVCSDGTTSFARVATGAATDAAWTQLTGTLTVPACTLTELTMYAEGPAAGVDIYLDDVSALETP